MSEKRCLYSYQLLDENEKDFHPKCSRSLFETTTPPILPYTEEQMLELAERVVKSQVTVTGVQPKLSLGIEKLPKEQVPERFTIVGLRVIIY